MKRIVVLNDGTDEIFNLHVFDIITKEEFFTDLVDTFMTSGLIETYLEDKLLTEATHDTLEYYIAMQDGDMYYDVATDLKKKFPEEYNMLVKELATLDNEGMRTFFITEDENVLDLVEKQNEDVENYKIEDFKLDWKELLLELGWN
jgi:predicted DNA-binding ArsR family transcriptional regulator